MSRSTLQTLRTGAAAAAFGAVMTGCAVQTGPGGSIPNPSQAPIGYYIFNSPDRYACAPVAVGEHEVMNPRRGDADFYNQWRANAGQKANLYSPSQYQGCPLNVSTSYIQFMYELNGNNGALVETYRQCANIGTMAKNFPQCRPPSPPKAALFRQGNQIMKLPLGECQVNLTPYTFPEPGTGRQIAVLQANCTVDRTQPYTVGGQTLRFP